MSNILQSASLADELLELPNDHLPSKPSALAVISMVCSKFAVMVLASSITKLSGLSELVTPPVQPVKAYPSVGLATSET